MKKLLGTMAVGMAIISLICGPAMAESSGNFAARIATAQCLINETSGYGGLEGGLTGTLLQTTIQTPNSGFTTLVIRPSLVTGLYTRTKVDYNDPAATAIAGVKVRVLVDGKVVAPGTPVGAVAGANDGWIYYDKRFQKLDTNIFKLLGQDCDPTEEGYEECYIDLILSTLSAHSFDFVLGDVGGGEHTVKVEWKLEPTSASADEAACVGPGVLTVQQTKAFSTGGGIVISTQN